MDVSAILIDPNTRRVTFGFPTKGPVKLSGVYELAQLAAFTILRKFSGDSFRTDYGTNFLQLAGSSNINDFDGLRADITLVIQGAADAIKQEQQVRGVTDPHELLAELIPVSIKQDTIDPTQIYIIIRVKNVSGETFSFELPSKT